MIHHLSSTQGGLISKGDRTVFTNKIDFKNFTLTDLVSSSLLQIGNEIIDKWLFFFKVLDRFQNPT